ncbi:Nitrate reductase cytochrome c-type subunit (NapB) [Polystyrenella longa]|uniref:Nitrate reductase cytochrome c-type subunit (NapB) n=1 Tax=Polystyrenella longa TaxID=2528007 RepID=A0A518CSY7_9PLAN|nr:diheme cytochrome c precursor [Polystyrenella longa]QDU82340.1 Nitrate reductase cytochrome c-type subunit (NapB) [Polystyrenella longa]
METEQISRIQILLSFIVVATAITGYFTGLQSPMNPVTNSTAQSHHFPLEDSSHPKGFRVIPATSYAAMPMANLSRTEVVTASLSNIRPVLNPVEEITVNIAEKDAALKQRDFNRAFNGAPPTVPHPVVDNATQSCMACHGEGAKTTSLRIPQMSHQFLANCLQCHVQQKPETMEPTLFRENTFVGLPAPEEGPRAFPLAPPQIPHPTWMRSNCMSCHGMTGLHGMRTTHPWRHNCMQCHAPSAELDQTKFLFSTPQFLPPPAIKTNKSSDGTEEDNND